MRLSPHTLPMLVVGVLCAAAASATTVLAVDPPQAVDEAELIFLGTVVDVETATSGDGLFPFTFVTFSVDETLKGSAADHHLTLRFEGGDLAEREETIEIVGMPTFELGDEVLLFVAGNRRAACPLVGWWQGKLDLIEHPATGERLLVDHRGAPLEGVDAGGWQTAEVRYDDVDRRFVDTEPGARLLWQEGVEIVEPTHARAQTYEGVTADAVLDDLRRLIEERRTLKSFTRVDVVRSASPLDVPESMTFRPVAPSE